MEIKFRVWDSLYNEMLYDKANSKGRCFEILMNNEQGKYLNGVYKNKPFSFMQFTGLLDKNGVEIYEGDVVDFGVTTNIKEIVFDGESASFRVYEYLYEQGSALAEKWFLDDCDYIEVIGNIYQTPELLGSK